MDGFFCQLFHIFIIYLSTFLLNDATSPSCCRLELTQAGHGGSWEENSYNQPNSSSTGQSRTGSWFGGEPCTSKVRILNVHIWFGCFLWEYLPIFEWMRKWGKWSAMKDECLSTLSSQPQIGPAPGSKWCCNCRGQLDNEEKLCIGFSVRSHHLSGISFVTRLFVYFF